MTTVPRCRGAAVCGVRYVSNKGGRYQPAAGAASRRLKIILDVPVRPPSGMASHSA